jgi:site-specific DNA-methyltransferase (cytosine-N4-specific)
VIYQGDALTVLRTLPTESVQSVVTSPPYWGLRDYGTATWMGGDPACDHRRRNVRPDHTGRTITGRGLQASSVSSATPYKACCPCGALRVDSQLGLEATPEEYVATMVTVFRDVRRVLRNDGTLWLNMGDSYAGNRGSQDAGQREVNGKTLSRRRDNAPIPRSDTRVVGLKPKDMVGMPWMVAFALRADGWYLRSDIIWAKPNPMPESVSDRPTKSHEYLFLLSKSERYFFDADAIRRPLQPKTFTTYGTRRHDPGDGSGLIKSENYAKSVPVRKPRLKTPDGWDTSKGESHGSFHKDGREKGHKQDGQQQISGGDRMSGFNARRTPEALESIIAGANARTVWTIATTPYPEAHFATFPEKLVEPCILAGTGGGGYRA